MTVTVRWLLISPLGCLLFREKFSSAFVSSLRPNCLQVVSARFHGRARPLQTIRDKAGWYSRPLYDLSAWSSWTRGAL